MTAQEHELLCRLKEEVDGIRAELIGFVKKVVVWAVIGAFALGGWSAAIQAQVWEQGRGIERIDLKGGQWSHEARQARDEQYAQIQESLARIEERLKSHMEARP